MQPVSAIARSGMSAAVSALGVSAHNLANLGTEGFRRQTIQSSEAADGGVSTQIGRAASAGHALERDVVDQLAAKNAFLANLAVFRSSEAMAGALLDLRA